MKVGKSYEIADYGKLPEYISKVIPKFFRVTSVDERNKFVEGVVGVDGIPVDSEVMVWTKSGIRFFHIPEEYYHCFREVEISYKTPAPYSISLILTLQ